MNALRHLALATVAGICLAGLANPSQAQAQVAVAVGPAPICPYGFYELPPYACAPYGYYGPEWFMDGVFIGAGPWYHGPAGFHGRVDSRLDQRLDHAGALPRQGELRNPPAPVERMPRFEGSAVRDGVGHEAPVPQGLGGLAMHFGGHAGGGGNPR